MDLIELLEIRGYTPQQIAVILKAIAEVQNGLV